MKVRMRPPEPSYEGTGLIFVQAVRWLSALVWCGKNDVNGMHRRGG